jgi:hypothetical protein
MAHWAEINEGNIVLRVLVGDNNDPNGDEGYQWLIDNLGGRWIKTSYNNNIRKQYAGVGFYYDEENDVFIAPKPFESWILDKNFDWQAPISKPREDRFYIWNEQETQWEIGPSPFPSWTLVDDLWTPPVARPQDDNLYSWNEEDQSWDLINLSTPNN